ncbi:hypothetical protein VTI74DRAFT_10921 [Chaetomium olivicolor]
MWSAIGLATARQARVGGTLAIRTGSRLVAQVTARNAPVVPCGIRVAAVFARSFAATKSSSKSATATKSAAAKKKPAAKKPAAKKAAKPKAAAGKTKKVKKEVSEETKTKLKIKELRQKALLREQVGRLPDSAWTVFMTQRVKAELKGGTVPARTVLKDMMSRLTSEYKALPAAEVEKLQAKANENKVANEVALRNWIDSYTPLQIRQANQARLLLKRKYNVNSKHQLPDDRFPAKACNPYIMFVKSRTHAPDLEGVHYQTKLSMIAKEWKALSDAERKPFEEMAATDKLRHQKEMDALKA